MTFAVLPAPVPARMRRAADPVARAIAAAGGHDILSRVRVLSWGGTAHVLLGTTAVDLVTELRIEPFVRSRSVTWLAGQGRSTARTVMVERDSAFLVQDGAQTPMPAARARFERQQLGVYAYLLLAPAFLSAAGPKRLNAVHDGYPPISLTLGPDARIAAADYALAAPDYEDRAVRQHLSFTGTVTAGGVRFPRTTTIVQDGRPFMRMTIADFSVELDPA